MVKGVRYALQVQENEMGNTIDENMNSAEIFICLLFIYVGEKAYLGAIV